MKEKILNWITENIDSYIRVDEESAKKYIDTSSLKYDLGKFIDSIESGEQ